MARLPTAADLGERPTPRPATGIASYRPAPPDSLAADIRSAGHEFKEAARVIRATNREQDTLAAEAGVNALYEHKTDRELGEQGFRRATGGSVVGEEFVNGHLGKLNQDVEQIAGGLQNDEQRQMFRQKAQVVSLQFRSAVMQHQAAETFKFNDQTASASMDAARRMIFEAPGDPMAMRAGLAKLDWGIDQKAKLHGWSPEMTAETKANYRSRVYDDVVTLDIERDPEGTLALLNHRVGTKDQPGAPTGNPAIDSLDPTKLAGLRHRAASYVMQDVHRQSAETDARLRDADRAVDEAIKFVQAGERMSPQYESELLARVAGTPREQHARQLVQVSYSAAAFGSQTLPAQRHDLRQYEAQSAQTGTSPEAKALVEHARSIHAAQEAAYKENPWAAATRFGRLPPTPEVALTSAEHLPALIDQREQLMTRVETYAGREVSPLQPNEARAAIGLLRGLPVETRAETLGRMGALLSPGQIEALAGQMDGTDRPMAIALKLADLRTNAGRVASVLVLQGAQALADKAVSVDEASVTGWKARIAEMVRGSLDNPELERQAAEAAYLVRVAMEMPGGNVAPGFDTFRGGRTEAAAVAMVIGTPVVRAGVKTVLPYGMDEGGFEQSLHQHTPEKLLQYAPGGTVYVRGQPRTLRQLSLTLPGMGFRKDGDGRYVPVSAGAPVTIDAAGTKLLRLDIR